MLFLEINNLKKYYGHRLVLDIKDFKAYSNDKIGLVGLNGSGKTTLLNLIAKEIKVDEGTIRTAIEPFYIKQLDEVLNIEAENQYISKLGLKHRERSFMSGGELTRLKIAQFLTDNRKFLLADEPTSNLDFDGIQLLTEKLIDFNGCLMIISHDRDLLDQVCNKIAEIEDGRIKVYEGNYSDYKKQKELEIRTQEFEYEKYIREKERLTEALIDTKKNAERIRTTPKRMGNSEARLHKMGGQANKKKQDNKVKAIAKRIEKLEAKSKVKELEKMDIGIQGNAIFSKIVLEGKNITKTFGKRTLFKDANFQIFNKSKVVVIGNNGSGKTTLLKMIMEGNPNIHISKSAKIGYFSQDLNILDTSKTIIGNVLESSIYSEAEVRNILARFLFRREDVYKKVAILSGGEKVKVSLAKILLSDFNLLILDEPTNYLDIYSIEALQEALINYTGTLFVVSHDKRLIDSIADTIMTIENEKIEVFRGNFEAYNNKVADEGISKDIVYRKVVLENRLSEVIGLLSIVAKEEEKEKFDLEYKEILKELNKIK